MLLLVHFSQDPASSNSSSAAVSRQLGSSYLGDFALMWILSVVSAYGMYFAVCGTLHVSTFYFLFLRIARLTRTIHPTPFSPLEAIGLVVFYGGGWEPLVFGVFLLALIGFCSKVACPATKNSVHFFQRRGF